MTREKRRVARATEQKRCRTNAAKFGSLKRIRGPCNVRTAVVKTAAKKKRMKSLLQQATFGGSADGRWHGAINLALERACRRRYAALDFRRRDKDPRIDTREYELPKRQKKTRAYKAWRGKITRHCGAKKWTSNGEKKRKVRTR